MKLAPKKLGLANEGADVVSPETPECSVPISTGDGATLETKNEETCKRY